MDFDPIEASGGALGRSVYELLRQRLIREVAAPSPSVGADWSVAVPAGVVWEILGVRGLLLTSAVVANRTPILVVKDPDGNEVARFPAPQSEAAGISWRNGWFAGLGSALIISGSQQALPSPPQIALGGWTVSVVTASLDVGDQWSQILLLVREWSVAEVQANLDYLMDSLRR